MNKGIISEVIGSTLGGRVCRRAPSRDQQCPWRFPLKKMASDIDFTVEVQQHLGGNKVRAIALGDTFGLVRGMEIVDTGAPISVPVGKATLGRIMDVLGKPVDDAGPIATDVKKAHSPSLLLNSLSWILKPRCLRRASR